MSQPTIQQIQMYEPYNGITLANGQIARKFDINPNWKRLRMGFRFVATTGSKVQIVAPHLTFGFCSGSNLYYSDDCGHFVGWQWKGHAPGNEYYSWRDGSAYNNYSYRGDYIDCRTIKKIGTTETQFSADVESNYPYLVCEYPASSQAQDKASFYIFDLTRPVDGNGNALASGSYSGYFRRDVWSNSDANYFIHPENECLMIMNETSPSPWYAGTSWGYTPLAHYFNIDEINDGYFDSVYMAWDKESPDPELKISHIFLSILS